MEFRGKSPPMTTPFFSIIVPAYDRPEALTACVQAIRQLDYPQDRFEVIIVDDGSPVPVKPQAIIFRMI